MPDNSRYFRIARDPASLDRSILVTGASGHIGSETHRALSPNFMSWKSRAGFAVLLKPKPNCHRILESGLRRRRTMRA